MPIFMFDKDEKYVVKTLGELLPLSFGPEDLRGGPNSKPISTDLEHSGPSARYKENLKRYDEDRARHSADRERRAEDLARLEEMKRRY
ncbi:MAG: hypothetical protein Q9181_008412 [Wetmoreana brouardii]